MIDERLIDAFDDCINRLATGESVEACLLRHPDLQAELRPMLEAGLLVQRSRYDYTTVEVARSRVKNRLSDILGSGGFPYNLVIGAVILAFVFGVVVGSIITRRSGAQPPPTLTTPSATNQPLSVVTAASTHTQVPTATPTTQPQQPSSTTVPTLMQTIPAPNATPSATNAASSMSDPIKLVIEGPVQSIEGDTITIYDTPLTFDTNAPASRVIELNDVIRVEAEVIDETAYIMVITFISVEVVISEGGEIWRDTGTCGAPPPNWVIDNGGGTLWLLRCARPPALPADGGNSSDDDDSGGGRQSSDDDDD